MVNIIKDFDTSEIRRIKEFLEDNGWTSHTYWDVSYIKFFKPKSKKWFSGKFKFLLKEVYMLYPLT